MARNRNNDTPKARPAREGEPIAAPVGRGLNLLVRHRRQTPEQSRHFETAVDVLLSELVRQSLRRGGEEDE
jgi:hypothetical protein